MIAAASLAIVVAIATNLAVIPISWLNSFVVAGSTTVQGFYQSWTLLNSTILELGSTVSGNATYPGFHYTGSNPTLYVLSPSQFTAWVSATPLAQPKVSTQTLQPILDFQNSILSFKFSFSVKEGGTYYFLMSGAGYSPPYGSSAALTYSATTLTPPLWYRVTAVLVPVGYVFARKVGEYRIVKKRIRPKL